MRDPSWRDDGNQTCSRISALQPRGLAIADAAARARQVDRRDRARCRLAQHDDPVGERHRLGHVMGDEHGGEAMLAQMRARSSCISARVSASSAPNGSSRSSTPGRLTRARASATRCFWPPESTAGQSLARSARPTSASAAVRRLAPARLARDADIADDALPLQQARILEEQPDGALQPDRPARRRSRTSPASARRARRSGAAASSCRRRSGRRRRRTARRGSRGRAPAAPGARRSSWQRRRERPAGRARRRTARAAVLRQAARRTHFGDGSSRS